MSSVGLDIGTTTMKAVFLERNNTKLQFKSAIVTPTPAKGMLSDATLDQEEIAQTIRKMLLDAKIPTHNVNLALPDNQVYAKVIDMPVLSDKELSSAIYWEAEQHIPVSLSTIMLDWKILRKDPDTAKSPMMQVLLVGAPMNILKKYEAVFELAGLNISSVEIEILSVIRSLAASEESPNSLLVNIGSLGTSIAILQKGIPVFLYTIPLGGIAMNRSIATEFGFSIMQAEEYKKAYGLEEKTFGGKIRGAIEPILSSMITEIKKAITYYVNKYKDDNSLKQIILSGGTAKLPGIMTIFAEQIDLETNIANPWKSLGVEGVPSELADKGSEYAIAAGLAVK